MHRLLLSMTAVLVALPSGVPVAAAAEPVPGARSLGDRLFPALGNGGYDAQDYDVSVTYQEGVETMPASVTMRATATQALSEFSLDSVGQRIHAVTVDGRAAGFLQENEKLVVTPPQAIRDRRSFTVRVDYTADRARNPTPPGAHLPPGVEWPLKAWVDTPDGFALMGQPDRAHLFFPSNDHPSDKAGFTFRITAPADRTAVANGTPIAKDTRDGVTTSVYRTVHPIPADVVQLAVGRFREVDQTGPGGLPVRSHLALARSTAPRSPTRWNARPAKPRASSPGWRGRSAARSRSSDTASSVSPAATTASRSRRRPSPPSAPGFRSRPSRKRRRWCTS
ncbi:MAG TPA: hypothetical protein VGP60_29510 [Amycolatopsis sp.]|nr:hypothetical protein [Amycolatopsis sp.]